VANPDQLSAAAERSIATALRGGRLYISSISCWEVALLVKKGRLRLTMSPADWVARSTALPYVRFVPIDNQIALRSIDLPWPLHDDPADRLIVATALGLGVPLITKDSRLHGLPRLETIW
jgi:PIN domain nuclease of toxin-antitoxin system